MINKTDLYTVSDIFCNCPKCLGKWALRCENYPGMNYQTFTMAETSSAVAPGNPECEYFGVTLGREDWKRIHANYNSEEARKQRQSVIDRKARFEKMEREEMAEFRNSPWAGMKFG